MRKSEEMGERFEMRERLSLNREYATYVPTIGPLPLDRTVRAVDGGMTPAVSVVEAIPSQRRVALTPSAEITSPSGVCAKLR